MTLSRIACHCVIGRWTERSSCLLVRRLREAETTAFTARRYDDVISTPSAAYFSECRRNRVTHRRDVPERAINLHC